MSMNFSRITKPHQPRRGEVWFVKELEFQGGDGSKSRPVVIISCGQTSATCYPCTSQPSAVRKRVQIFSLATAGLERDTYIDLEPISVPVSKLNRKMGELSPKDRKSIRLRS